MSIDLPIHLAITISICQSIYRYSIAADPGAGIGLVEFKTTSFFQHYIYEGTCHKISCAVSVNKMIRRYNLFTERLNCPFLILVV